MPSAYIPLLRRHTAEFNLSFHRLLHFLFLDASTHLYKSSCPSVGPLVGPLVGPSVGYTFAQINEKRPFTDSK